MHLATWAGLACLALAIRPLVYGVTPLLPQVQAELAIAFSLTALLVSVPVLASGVASLGAPFLAQRLGVRPTAALALLAMLAAGVARALFPDLGGMVLASVPLGIGAGIVGVLLPMIVKSSVPTGSQGTGTGVYTVGLQLGGALTAAICVPIATVTGGWRPAFIALAGLTALLVAGWFVLSGQRTAARPGAVEGAAFDHHAAAGPPPATRRWLVPTVIVFALLVLLFQGINAWLPALYVEHGWSEAAAGGLLGLLVLAQVPGTLLAGWLADRRGQRRTYLAVPGLVVAMAIALLVSAPQLAPAWALAAGVALGFIAPIALVIALDFGATSAAVGRGSALIMGVGYIVASASPFVVGAVRDVSGSFAVGLGALAFLALALAAAGWLIPVRQGLQPARRLS